MTTRHLGNSRMMFQKRKLQKSSLCKSQKFIVEPEDDVAVAAVTVSNVVVLAIVVALDGEDDAKVVERVVVAFKSNNPGLEYEEFE